MDTQAIGSDLSANNLVDGSNVATGLGGEDFLKLLVAQLSNQDPLEPTSNQGILDQVSSIREIELSTNLSSSLEALTKQQRSVSAASLIGRFVTGSNGTEQGESASGTVVAVHFNHEGSAVLELDDGTRMPIERVLSITESERIADDLVGQFVAGYVDADTAEPRLVEGLVIGTTVDENGRITVELDNGESLGIGEIVSAQGGSDVGRPGSAIG